MHRAHRASINLDGSKLETIDAGKVWSFPSQNTISLLYNIIKIKDNCSCKLQCRSCSVCPDMYECSCDFSIVSDSACKHVHLVHEHENSADDNTGMAHQYSPPPKFSAASNDKKKVCRIEMAVEMSKILTCLSTFLSNGSFKNNDNMERTLMKLKEAHQICQLDEQTDNASPISFPATKKQAPNKLSSQQRAFKSIKRISKRPNSTKNYLTMAQKINSRIILKKAGKKLLKDS